MNQIKTIKFFLIFSIIFVAINIAATSNLDYTNNSKFRELSFSKYSFDDFKNKSYYTKIFNSDDRKKLDKANKYTKKANRFLSIALKLESEIDKYKKIANSTSDEKTKTKALKKADKIGRKLSRKGLKAIKFFDKALDIKKDVYSRNMKNVRYTDATNHSKAGSVLEKDASILFTRANIKVSESNSKESVAKYIDLKNANNLRQEAFTKQEIAFGLYMKDPAINPDTYLKKEVVSKDTTKKIVKVDTTKITKVDTNKIMPKDTSKTIIKKQTAVHYNPVSDTNLYKSYSHLIYPKLKLSDNEKRYINQIKEANVEANQTVKEVDESYVKIDALRSAANKATNVKEREKLKGKAETLEQKAFYKLLQSSESYIASNKTKYKIYKDHLKQHKSEKKTPENELAADLIKNSNQLMVLADSEIKLTRKMMYKSNKYIAYMEAISLQLLAIQEIEYAYGIYLNIPEIKNKKHIPSYANVYNKNTKHNNKINNGKTKKTGSFSWKQTGSYTYSVIKPKPQKLIHKKGIVFKVQIGILKKLLKPENFKGLMPVAYDVFKNNPFKRFLLGEYRTAEAANYALAKTKKTKYKDAFIVAYVDGKRKSFNYAKSKLKKDDKYKKLIKIEKAIVDNKNIKPIKDTKIISKKVYVSTKNKGLIKKQSINKSKGLVYCIQLGMFSKAKSYADFKNYNPVYTEILKGRGTKYMVGAYGSYNAAKTDQNKVVKSGLKGAYIVCYYNGKSIKISEAKNIEKKRGKTKDVVISSAKKKDTIVKVVKKKNPVVKVVKKKTHLVKVVKKEEKLIYKIQIAAYKKKLSVAEQKKYLKISSKRNINIMRYNGLHIYSLGSFSSYKNAKKFQSVLKKEGTNGYLVAFYKHKKIDIKKAITLEK